MWLSPARLESYKAGLGTAFSTPALLSNDLENQLDPNCPWKDNPRDKDGWPIIVYPPLPAERVKKQLTWVSQLPPIPDKPSFTDIIKAEGKTYEFLSRYLADRRVGEIPFLYSYKLVNFLLRMVSASAFEALQRWAPNDLVLLNAHTPEQLEPRWWLDLIKEWERRYPKPSYTDGTDWDLLQEVNQDYGVGALRHTVIHRQEYSTDFIKDSVKFLLALNDLTRFKQVESVVRTLYGTLSGNIVVTKEESLKLHSTLALYPARCTTVYDLYFAIQNILENVYFRYQEADDQDWLDERKVTVAEQLELYRPEYLAHSWYSAGFSSGFNHNLRIWVAHHLGDISDPTPNLEYVQYMAVVAGEIALDLDDEVAAAEIEKICADSMPYLQRRSDAYKSFLHGLSAQQCVELSQQAQRKHRLRDPYFEDKDWDRLAHRYRKTHWFFRDLAKLKDGTTYRDNHRWLLMENNRVHENWQAIQRTRYNESFGTRSSESL